MMLIDLDNGLVCGSCKVKDIREKGLIKASLNEVTQ